MDTVPIKSSLIVGMMIHFPRQRAYDRMLGNRILQRSLLSLKQRNYRLVDTCNVTVYIKYD